MVFEILAKILGFFVFVMSLLWIFKMKGMLAILGAEVKASQIL